MQAIQKLIESHGGLDELRKNGIKICREGYMPLCIDWLGDGGPRGLPVVAVYHYYIQNGDVMMDPEIVFEVSTNECHPISYRQDSLGIFQDAVFREGDVVKVDERILKDLKGFARFWDGQLKAQGYCRDT